MGGGGLRLHGCSYRIARYRSTWSWVQGKLTGIERMTFRAMDRARRVRRTRRLRPMRLQCAGEAQVHVDGGVYPGNDSFAVVLPETEVELTVRLG